LSAKPIITGGKVSSRPLDLSPDRPTNPAMIPTTAETRLTSTSVRASRPCGPTYQRNTKGTAAQSRPAQAAHKSTGLRRGTGLWGNGVLIERHSMDAERAFQESSPSSPHIGVSRLVVRCRLRAQTGLKNRVTRRRRRLHRSSWTRKRRRNRDRSALSC
jgi:hypothetical protein